MSTEFITDKLWPQLTKAARGSRQRCAVAVAYFGSGASRLLPLPEGSVLVVDASERSVASGQTCPFDLISLMKRGVSIYTVPNLHAKVFVLGRSAYIGSSNVSSRSASYLVEAALRTSEPSTVLEARRFVEQHCLHELTPKVLNRLAKVYRPPIFPGGKLGKKPKSKTSTNNKPILPRVFLAQLEREAWPERDQALHDKGLIVAKKRRKHRHKFELQSFRLTEKLVYQRDDVVIQVTEEGSAGVLVSAPGNVVHIQSRREGTQMTSFVYIELPVRRRRQVNALARDLGYVRQNRFYRDGLIKDQSFARALLNIWATRV